jgi:hypothetical protein
MRGQESGLKILAPAEVREVPAAAPGLGSDAEDADTTSASANSTLLIDIEIIECKLISDFNLALIAKASTLDLHRMHLETRQVLRSRDSKAY